MGTLNAADVFLIVSIALAALVAGAFVTGSWLRRGHWVLEDMRVSPGGYNEILLQVWSTDWRKRRLFRWDGWDWYRYPAESKVGKRLVKQLDSLRETAYSYRMPDSSDRLRFQGRWRNDDLCHLLFLPDEKLLPEERVPKATLMADD